MFLKKQKKEIKMNIGDLNPKDKISFAKALNAGAFNSTQRFKIFCEITRDCEFCDKLLNHIKSLGIEYVAIYEQSRQMEVV